MEKPQKPKSGQPQKAANQPDARQPGHQPRQPQGTAGDVRNPRPAPGTGRDPLVHPGDEPDIQPDVIAGQGQPAKQGTPQQGGRTVADKPGSQAVSGQGNAKP